MNSKEINDALLAGRTDDPGVLPHLDALRRAPIVFQVDFGLQQLPAEPGVLVIRGARQYGKSTWMEQQVLRSIQEFGTGSTLYLNGDELADDKELADSIRTTLPFFSASAPQRRLFIDEIAAVPRWEKALKRLADGGEIADVLVVTTGSKATDLRRGAERLPGRKGKLARTSYYFTPVAYREFHRQCAERLGPSTLSSYLLSGGCPHACAEIATSGSLPEYITETVRDWMLGECAATGRSRHSLVAVMRSIEKFGASPSGQLKIARDSGLANNTVAAGYLELLADLVCVLPCYSWDHSRQTIVQRAPAKYHFVNLLAAIVWNSQRPRSTADLDAMAPAARGMLHEWAVGQELWRRAAIAGADDVDHLLFWQGGGHELDFVDSAERFIEVKLGAVAPSEYAWFPAVHPKARLEIVNRNRFETGFCRGVTLEDFLLQNAD